MKKQSLLVAISGRNLLPLLPPVDFFRSSVWCKLFMYSLAHFRPRESRTVNYVSCHWGLFPEELVEIEWIGYRECQEITYWVQKHFYH